LGVPPTIANLSSDLYRDAYLLGWQTFSIRFRTEEAQAQGRGELQEAISGRTIPPPPNADDVLAYDAYEKRIKAVYTSAFVDGWEAAALTYVKDGRKKKN